MKTSLDSFLSWSIAGRTKNPAGVAGKTDFGKAGLTLTAVLPVAYAILSFLATYAPEIGEYLRDNTTYAQLSAGLIAVGAFAAKLASLFLQGPAVPLDPKDPTVTDPVPGVPVVMHAPPSSYTAAPPSGPPPYSDAPPPHPMIPPAWADPNRRD